jgi:hypothetical protein
MSQTYFSKQNTSEKLNKLSLLGSSRGTVTLWLKGKKDKYIYDVLKFDKDRVEIVLDSSENKFSSGSKVLCTFELRGMNFFSEITFQISSGGFSVLQFNDTLYKSERRSSYRLMTFPMHQIWANFNLENLFQGGEVIDLKSKANKNEMFKKFLELAGEEIEGDNKVKKLKIRIQDLSTTGMAIHIGEIESHYLKKDMEFKNVEICFKDEKLIIPSAKIVYLIEINSRESDSKKYKLGIQFENLPTLLDQQIGVKINNLLRENDSRSDFENLLK